MYIPTKTLLTTQRVKLVEKKEFSAIALNSNDKTFVVYIVFIASSNFANSNHVIHPSYWTHIASLKVDEALIAILSKYIDFIDVFSSNLVAKLSEYTRINNHTIKLINGKQSPYKPIYRLKPI